MYSWMHRFHFSTHLYVISVPKIAWGISIVCLKFNWKKKYFIFSVKFKLFLVQQIFNFSSSETCTSHISFWCLYRHMQTQTTWSCRYVTASYFGNCCLVASALFPSISYSSMLPSLYVEISLTFHQVWNIAMYPFGTYHVNWLCAYRPM